MSDLESYSDSSEYHREKPHKPDNRAQDRLKTFLLNKFTTVLVSTLSFKLKEHFQVLKLNYKQQIIYTGKKKHYRPHPKLKNQIEAQKQRKERRKEISTKVEEKRKLEKIELHRDFLKKILTEKEKSEAAIKKIKQERQKREEKQRILRKIVQNEKTAKEAYESMLRVG